MLGQDVLIALGERGGFAAHIGIIEEKALGLIGHAGARKVAGKKPCILHEAAACRGTRHRLGGPACRRAVPCRSALERAQKLDLPALLLARPAVGLHA